jgi:30S ribosomal protein S31
LFIFENWYLQKKIILQMGKGDQKSKKGKISSGSYGVSRKKKKTAAYVAETKTEVAATEGEKPAKKAAAKK